MFVQGTLTVGYSPPYIYYELLMLLIIGTYQIFLHEMNNRHVTYIDIFNHRAWHFITSFIDHVIQIYVGLGKINGE